MSVRRALAWALVLVTAFASTVAVALRLVPWLHTVDRRLAEAASFIPVGLLGWTVVMVGAGLLARRRACTRERSTARGLAAFAGCGLVLQTLWVAPFFVPDRPDVPVVKEVRVSVLNVMYGWADTDRVLEEMSTSDVVVLVEATDEYLERLEAQGLTATLAHRAGRTGIGAKGTVLLSRWPLREVDLPNPTVFHQVGVVVDVPDAVSLAVLGVHPVNPTAGARRWTGDAEATRGNARHLLETAPASPLVMAGDFNATPDHVTMRRLTGDLRLRYAADVAGAGWLWTWPVGYSPVGTLPVPTVLPIDHVLVGRSVDAVDVTSFSVRGSDHRGLHATLGIPAAR